MQAFENEFIRINYLEEESILHAEWLRSVSSEEYRSGVALSLRYLKEFKAVYWLIDARQLHGTRIADQQWVLQEIVPQLSGLKVRKLARIGTSDIFHYMSFEDMAQKAAEATSLQVDVAQFTSMEAARAWLLLYEGS